MKKDPRITVKRITWGKYLAVYFAIAFICSTTLIIYIEQVGMPENQWFLFSIVGLIIALSGAGCGILSLLQISMVRPVRKLSEAAQQVAKGDFSIRLQPMRRDGKKDEFEILFEDFNTMIEELSSTETLKTDFISNVSHEMKTPLAVIRNYAQLLEAPNLSEYERMQYTRYIQESAIKMTELITNILRLNRIENQTIVPKKKSFDVCRQLADCLMQFESLWEEKNIEPDFDFEERTIIIGDESLLEMVWNNLMSNALKFIEHGEMITVRQWTEGEKVLVSFSDTGCGMSENTKKHIFDKFYQGDTSHATEGNGLGLTLVHRIISLHSGEIWVESEQGKGSTFTVCLPRFK